MYKRQSQPRLVHQRSQQAPSSSARTMSSAASRSGPAPDGPGTAARRARSARARRWSPMTLSRTTPMTGTMLAAANRHAAHIGPYQYSRTAVQASPALVAM